jgi:PAS domain S-box-containing protein
MNKDEDAGFETAHSYEIINTIKEIENDLKDLGLARRGYVMSGEVIFLESLELKKQTIREKLNELIKLSSTNVVQYRNVKLLQSRISIVVSGADGSISTYHINRGYDSLQQMFSAISIVSMYSINLLFKEIESGQRLLLVQKSLEHAEAVSILRKFIISGNISAVFMIIMSVILIRKQIREKVKESAARKLKEKELGNKQKELETLMNIMPVGVYYFDSFSNCIYVNDSWSKITGYLFEEVYGTDLMHVIHPDDREKVFNSLSKSLAEGRKFSDEYRFLCKNGQVKHIFGEASMRLDSNGVLLGFIGSVMDISEQHNFKEELIKYNRLFEALAEGIPDPIFVKDINGKYEFINTPAAKMIGKEIEDIIGKTDHDVFPEVIAKDTIEKDRAVYENEEILNYELSTVMPDGTLKTFLTTKGIIRNSLNKPIGLFGILRDITSFKENENNIKRSLTQKETLLREVHHRVKNNLQVVASLLRLQAGYIKDPESRHFFRDSQNRISTIAILHEKLYGSESFTSVELKRYVEQLMDILITSLGINREVIKINTDIEELDIDVEYSVPIGLVLNEIITNSFKYAFPGNRTGEIFVNIYKIDDKLNIRIGDNGIGLCEELDIEHLESLGLQLIFTLVEGQLAGKVKFIHSTAGLVYDITIPVKVPVLQ